MDNTENNELREKPKSDIPRSLGFIIGFFGIFFSTIGFFALLAIFLKKTIDTDAGAMSDKEIYSLFLTCTSLLFAFAAIYIGYKLIKRLDIGRKLFNLYTLIVIAASFGHYLYKQSIINKSFANMPAELAAAAKGNESAATFTLFILPSILIVVVVVLNLRKMRESLN